MSVFELHDRETFMFTAENPTAARNGGSKEGDCSKPSAFVEIAPGQTVTIADAEGPGVITHIWVGQVSRSVILRAYWDGAESPSVEAPLSAFFGRAYDENVLDVDGRYTYLNSALLLDAPASAVNAYFEMPFRRRCLMTLENRSGESKIIFYAVSGWRGEIPASAGYFHAVYRQEKPVTKGRAYTVLDVSGGKGRFLGMTLAAGMNGANSCWVEGETKIYLDGDVYPTLNYTGTEDYFCGAYAFGNDSVSHRYQTYSGLYAGMYAVYGNDTQNPGGHGSQYNGQQRFLLYRWHVKDAIYFGSGVRVTLDSLGWTGPRYDDFATVAYWYMDRPQKTPFALPPDGELCMR